MLYYGKLFWTISSCIFLLVSRGSCRKFSAPDKCDTGYNKERFEKTHVVAAGNTGLVKISPPGGRQPSWVGYVNSRTGTDDEAKFDIYLRETFNPEAERVAFDAAKASWAYETNLTEFNRDRMIEASRVAANFDRNVSDTVLYKFRLDQITDPKLRRLYNRITITGNVGLQPLEFIELQVVTARMEDIYSTAKICSDPTIAVANMALCPAEKILELEPGITRLMASSRDPELLQHVWQSWREASGKLMRQDYARYVDLKNKAADNDGVITNGNIWRYPYVENTLNYTDVDFLNDIKHIWEDVAPLYHDLHAYIRSQLQRQYPTVNITNDGPIPAHLLGDMWAQTWGNIGSFSQPYPKEPSLDVTPAMVAKNYTALMMFQISDKFFTDLGMIPMPAAFWTNSMIQKPEDRNVVCHASAWDFSNRKDFRIKQCTDITMDDLLT